MGNSSKQPQDYDVVRSYRPEEWLSYEKRPGYEIWENKAKNVRAEVYPIKSEIKSSDLDHYQMRYNNSQDIVRVHNLSMDKQPGMCSKSNDSHVLVQRIPCRLSDVHDLTEPEALSVLRSAYSGFNTLSTFYGPIEPYQDLICFNEQGKTKVWVNSDLSKNGSIWDKEPNTGLTANKNASYINKILDMVEHKTQNGALPQKLKNMFRQNQPKTYFQALNLVQQYASNQSLAIPSSININRWSTVSKVQSSELRQSNTGVRSHQEFPVNGAPLSVDSVINKTIQSTVARPNIVSSVIPATFNPSINNNLARPIVQNENYALSNVRSRFLVGEQPRPVQAVLLPQRQPNTTFVGQNVSYAGFPSKNNLAIPVGRIENTYSNISVNRPQLATSPICIRPPTSPLQFQNTPQRFSFQSPSKVAMFEQLRSAPVAANNNNIVRQTIQNTVSSFRQLSPEKPTVIQKMQIVENAVKQNKETVKQESNNVEPTQIKSQPETPVLNRPAQPIQSIPRPQQIGIPSVQRAIQQNVIFNRNTISFFGRPYVHTSTNPNSQLVQQQSLKVQQQKAVPTNTRDTPVQPQLSEKKNTVQKQQQKPTLNQNQQQLVDQYERNQEEHQDEQNYSDEYEQDDVERHLEMLEDQKFYDHQDQKPAQLMRNVIKNQATQTKSNQVQKVQTQTNQQQKQQQLQQSQQKTQQKQSQQNQQSQSQSRSQQQLPQQGQGLLNGLVSSVTDRKLQTSQESSNEKKAEQVSNGSGYFPFTNQFEKDTDLLKRVTTMEINGEQFKNDDSDQVIKKQSIEKSGLQLQNLNQQSTEKLEVEQVNKSEREDSGNHYEYQRQNYTFHDQNNDRIPDNAKYDDIESYIRNKYRTYIETDSSAIRPSSEVYPYAGYTAPEVDVRQMASYVESKYDHYTSQQNQFSFRPTDQEEKSNLAPTYDFMRIQKLVDEILPDKQAGEKEVLMNKQKSSNENGDDDMLDVKNMERSLDKKYNSMKSNQQIKELDALKKQENEFDVKNLAENLVRFQQSRVGSGSNNQAFVNNSEPRFQTSQVSKIHSIDERLTGNRRSSMNRDYKDTIIGKYSYENQSPAYEFGSKSRASKVSKEIIDIDEDFKKYVKQGAGLSSGSSKQILRPKQDNYGGHKQYDNDSSSRMATGHFGNVQNSRGDGRKGYEAYGTISKNYRASEYQEKKGTLITSEVRSPKSITYEELRKFMWS